MKVFPSNDLCFFLKKPSKFHLLKVKKAWGWGGGNLKKEGKFQEYVCPGVPGRHNQLSV